MRLIIHVRISLMTIPLPDLMICLHVRVAIHSEAISKKIEISTKIICFFFIVCPELCHCSFRDDGGMLMKCNNQLKYVPERIPHSVVVIDLSYTYIKKLHNDSFLNCGNVIALNLASTEISSIRNSMLVSMPILEVIHLTLSYNKASFPDNTFENLLHLKSVNIQTAFSHATLEEFDFIMQKLPGTLEELNVNIPGFEGISQRLMAFTKLKKLGLYGHPAYQKTLANDTFELLKHLPIVELTIKLIRISTIQPLTFYYLPELKLLDMTGTPGLSIADFFPAFIGLKNTKLERLILSYMHGSDIISNIPDLAILNDSFCDNLILPQLTDLQIDHTHLLGIRYNYVKPCFAGLPKLRTLNMSFNFIHVFEVLEQLDLNSLPSLSELDIKYQYDLTFGSQVSAYIEVSPNLTHLDMSNIRCAYNNQPLSFSLLSATNLRFINFQNNFVTNLSEFAIERHNSSIFFELIK